MRANEMRAAIRLAWRALEEATDSDQQSSEFLYRAHLAAEAGERGHRRFVGSGYRLSVDDAAKYHVLRHAYNGSIAPRSWVDVASTRDDCVLAYAVHERLQTKKGKGGFGMAFPDLAFLQIDYARDVAK